MNCPWTLGDFLGDGDGGDRWWEVVWWWCAAGEEAIGDGATWLGHAMERFPDLGRYLRCL